MAQRRHGVLWLTLGVTISLLLGTGIGYFATGGAPAAQRRQAQAGLWAPMLPVAPNFADPKPALAPDGVGGEAATSDGLARSLAALVANARFGNKLGLSVVDAETGEQLYGVRDDVQVTPASTTKIVTAVAVLAAFGPYHRFTTKVVAGESEGEVVLVGGGDPTMAVADRSSYVGASRLDALAKQVKAAGSVTKVTVDSTLFTGADRGPGWEPTIVSQGFVPPVSALTINGGRTTPTEASSKAAPRTPTPDLFAGKAFADLLGVSTVARGTAPEGARELGKLQSPTVQHLVELMLNLSDNAIAESLLRQVALAKGQPATFEGAQEAVKGILTELGLDAAGHGLVDGSGLSRGNKISPKLLTAILHAVTGSSRPALRGVLTGLPVAAYSGTLANRFGAARSAAGDVRAKTGSLAGVRALAGVVVAENGRQLAFAAITDGIPPGGESGAEAGLDEIGAALAGCGCS